MDGVLQYLLRCCVKTTDGVSKFTIVQTNLCIPRHNPSDSLHLFPGTHVIFPMVSPSVPIYPYPKKHTIPVNGPGRDPMTRGSSFHHPVAASLSPGIIYSVTGPSRSWKYDRRKFRSETSDNMGSWKSRGGKSQRGKNKKREDQRGETVSRKKM